MNYNDLDLALDILNEANIDGKAKSESIRFYEHLIKWKYQPYLQRPSWINTIIDSSREIYNCCYDKKKKKMDANTVNTLNNILYSNYITAFNKSLDDMSELKNKPKFEDEIYYLFPTVEAIINEDAVRAYMKQGAIQAIIDIIDGKRR